MSKLIKLFLIFLSAVIFLLSVVFCYFFVGSAPVVKNITWGVDFSQMQAESLKLNWKETYLALINDLGIKNIKLHTQWDWVEGKKDDYYFGDIDWQLKTAEQNKVQIIYVVGLKTGRWPECHIPAWATAMSEKDQQAELLKYITVVVQRYKNSSAITNWQVENEPLFNFGQCPAWYYKNTDFLQKEVALVKLLDPSRKVIVSDSGELSTWFPAANIGDILGTTMYRKAWVNISSFGFNFTIPGFYGAYPFSPVFYTRKAGIINFLFGKKVICIELQAEPWAKVPFNNVPLQEQAKTMNLQQFKDNVEYAKDTGLDTFYFWGPEWWYWMKTVNNQPEIWNEAKKIFQSNQT